MTPSEGTSTPSARPAVRPAGLRWRTTQLRVLLGSTREVFRDDPVSFVLLVAQQLPAKIVQIAAGGAAVLTRPFPPLVAWRCVALWVRGLEGEALELASRRTGVRREIQCARFLVAVRDYPRAEAVLGRLPAGARPVEAAWAQLEWRRGKLDDALGRARASRLSPRQVIRWASERAVLEPGWAPPPPQPVAYAGEAGRVLHLLTNSLPVARSGYTTRSHEIMSAQRRAGIDPVAVTRAGYPAVVGAMLAAPVSVIDGIEYRRLMPSHAPRSAESLAAAEVDLLARLVEEVRPAVLHTTTHHVNAVSALAVGRGFGIPVVYEVRGFLEDTWAGLHGEGAVDSDRYRLWRARETESMLAADLVVTLGEAMRTEILARGVPAGRVLVAPNAVPVEAFSPLPGRSAVRAELGVGSDDLLVGSVTSVVPYEGLDVAVDAVAELGRRGVAATLVVVGDGTARAALQRRAEAAGVRAVFTGRVGAARARAYREALDVFVVPRRDESVTRLVTPLKPVEAMAGGVAVVASDLAPLREIVMDGVTGRLVPPSDALTLADVLHELAQDPAARAELGAAGRRWARAHRTWDAVAETYATAYRSLKG